MARVALWIGVVGLVVGGCGDGEAAPTSTSTVPPTTISVAGSQTALEAVSTWLDALSIGRYAVADEVVVENQFVLMLAVESYSVELYDELMAGGITPEISRTFWESFVAGVRGFTGADITEVEVVGQEPFVAYGRQFAAVSAESPRGDLTIVAVLGPDQRWYVDLLATFGPGFAPLFNLWIDRLPPDATGPIDVLAGEQASLEVGRDRIQGAGGEEARAELTALLERLAA